MTQFHVTPERYLDLMRRAIPAYDELQEAIGRATDGVDALRVLDLGTESRSAYRMAWRDLVVIVADRRRATTR
jgi:hypothetical protein